MGLDSYIHKQPLAEEVLYLRKAQPIHNWFAREYERKFGGNEFNLERLYLTPDLLNRFLDDLEELVLEDSYTYNYVKDHVLNILDELHNNPKHDYYFISWY